MSTRIRFLLPLAALCFVPSAPANTDLAYVKCAVNQDRVWVYESLGSFDVEARLRCGAPVEILSRMKGFVKIRTESGVEGFVPDSTFPDLPALPDDADKPLGNATPQSLAALVRKPAPVSTSAPAAAASSAPAPAVAVQAPIQATAPVASVPQSVVAVSTASAPAAPMPVKAVAPAKPTTSAAPAATKISTAPAHKPAASAAKKPEAAPNAPASAVPRVVAPAPAAPPAPAKPAMETVSTSMRDSVTMVPATALPVAKPLEDPDEYPDTQPENESADPACRVYFAAYGLAPSQYKWMAESRRKEFSGICPAPDVAHVDYVVLFTHDSDAYTYAMPIAVHTDHNGFSDFSPLSTVDTALVNVSDLEKTRFEFVWVFRVTRGSFDPSRFSARRKPQFTTYVKGSRASSRAIEDAFGFVQTQGMER